MWLKKDHRKKGLGVTRIFRLFISLLMMAVLGIGLYQAYRAFSGYDPLAVSPTQAAKSLINPDSLYELITGLLTLNPSQSLDKAKEVLKADQNISESPKNKSNSPLKFKFAVISDSHNDNTNLAKALASASAQGAKFVIGLGDYTDVGTIEEFSRAKSTFDNGGLTYYPTVGDHDLWDSRDKKKPDPAENFIQVFGTVPYQAFSFEDVRFILVYNSDNYLGLDEPQINWVEEELDKVKKEGSLLTLVFTSIPLFHPSSDHVMGKTNAKLKNQADHLISIFKRAGVDEVFAGDTHFFSRYKEPKEDLNMTNVGAVTSVRNPQTPRFVLVDIFEDGSYNISDVEIK